MYDGLCTSFTMLPYHSIVVGRPRSHLLSNSSKNISSSALTRSPGTSMVTASAFAMFQTDSAREDKSATVLIISNKKVATSPN